MNQPVISWWLGLPGWAILLVLIAFYTATGAVIHFISFRPAWRNTMLSFSGTVPPFFVSPGIIFALMMGFLASDVWERDRLASHGVLDERDSVAAAYDLAAATGPAMPKLREATRDYLASVLHDELPLMHHEGEAPQTALALDRLMHLVMDPAIAQQAGPALQGALIAAVLRVSSDRSSLLALSANETDSYKWSFVLLLALLGQIGVGIVHLDRAKPQIMAMLIFTASSITALGLIAICEEPFHGWHQVSLVPLEVLLKGLPNAS
jgi:hypothetical protein